MYSQYDLKVLWGLKFKSLQINWQKIENTCTLWISFFQLLSLPQGNEENMFEKKSIQEWTSCQQRTSSSKDRRAPKNMQDGSHKSYKILLN